MGHFVALGPLKFLNLNISTIWVRDPWVSIQSNFWGSLQPIKEVPHTCKIVNYISLPIYFWQGGANCWVNGLWKGARGWGPEGWGQGVGQGGWGKGSGVRGWNLYLNEVFYKTGIVTSD